MNIRKKVHTIIFFDDVNLINKTLIFLCIHRAINRISSSIDRMLSSSFFSHSRVEHIHTANNHTFTRDIQITTFTKIFRNCWMNFNVSIFVLFFIINISFFFHLSFFFEITVNYVVFNIIQNWSFHSFEHSFTSIDKIIYMMKNFHFVSSSTFIVWYRLNLSFSLSDIYQIILFYLKAVNSNAHIHYLLIIFTVNIENVNSRH
jgi:hypothetical protein